MSRKMPVLGPEIVPRLSIVPPFTRRRPVPPAAVATIDPKFTTVPAMLPISAPYCTPEITAAVAVAAPFVRLPPNNATPVT